MHNIKNILNDNERFNKSSNINVIDRNDPYYIDKTADWLLEKLGSPTSRGYYCKAASHIPRPYLDYLVTMAVEKGHHPAKLFIFLAEKKIRQLGAGEKKM